MRGKGEFEIYFVDKNGMFALLLHDLFATGLAWGAPNLEMGVGVYLWGRKLTIKQPQMHSKTSSYQNQMAEMGMLIVWSWMCRL